MIDWAQDFPAPAKINLFLYVIGRRPDGYHLLQSVMRLLDHGDSLHFAPRSDDLVRRGNVVAGVAEDQDLCVRAARLLQQAAGVKQGVTITLTKRLPLGGGLGGGSSDAATTLFALNRLWDVNWSRARLQELGLQLGADVPFFIFGRSAFVEGAGERLQAIDLPPAWYLVLEPPVSVATAEIFTAPELTRDSKPLKIADFSAACAEFSADFWCAERNEYNALQAVVSARYAPVALALEWLKHHGSARMSGSGACVFAHYATQQEAAEVLAKLPAGWRGWVGRGLDRHPLWYFAD